MKKAFLSQIIGAVVLCLALLSSPASAQYRNQINAMAARLQGVSYAQQGDWARAAQAFDLATRLKPDYAEAYGQKGFSLAMLRQFQEALESFDQAIRLRPYEGVYWLGKGIVLAAVGRQAQAEQHIGRAFQLSPQLAMDPNVIGMLHQAGISVGSNVARPSTNGYYGGRSSSEQRMMQWENHMFLRRADQEYMSKMRQIDAEEQRYNREKREADSRTRGNPYQ
jgi:tetratricopeptide (TPR) repeat protein